MTKAYFAPLLILTLVSADSLGGECTEKGCQEDPLALVGGGLLIQKATAVGSLLLQADDPFSPTKHTGCYNIIDRCTGSAPTAMQTWFQANWTAWKVGFKVCCNLEYNDDLCAELDATLFDLESREFSGGSLVKNTPDPQLTEFCEEADGLLHAHESHHALAQLSTAPYASLLQTMKSGLTSKLLMKAASGAGTTNGLTKLFSKASRKSRTRSAKQCVDQCKANAKCWEDVDPAVQQLLNMMQWGTGQDLQMLEFCSSLLDEGECTYDSCWPRKTKYQPPWSWCLDLDGLGEDCAPMPRNCVVDEHYEQDDRFKCYWSGGKCRNRDTYKCWEYRKDKETCESTDEMRSAYDLSGPSLGCKWDTTEGQGREFCRPEDAECFPSGALVSLSLDRTDDVPVEQLRRGLQLVSPEFQSNASSTSNADFMIDSHFFEDDVETRVLDFVEISHEFMKSGRPLIMTSNHLLFVQRQSGDQRTSWILERADAVHEGDFVFSLHGGVQHAHASKVTSVRWVKAKGMYAPITTSGRLFVEGVAVSSMALSRRSWQDAWALGSHSREARSLWSERLLLWSLFPSRFLYELGMNFEWLHKPAGRNFADSVLEKALSTLLWAYSPSAAVVV